jgi:hypothetical protein
MIIVILYFDNHGIKYELKLFIWINLSEHQLGYTLEM